MPRSALAAALLAAGLHASPALADEVAPPRPAPVPWVAAGLTLAAPMGLGMLGSAVAGQAPAAAPYFLLALPLATGAGHWYAGDAARGAWSTLITPGAALAGGALTGVVFGYVIAPATQPSMTGLAGFASGFAIGAFVGGAAGLGYTAADAYRTAERAGAPQPQ